MSAIMSTLETMQDLPQYHKDGYKIYPYIDIMMYF
jgi:hypothetical protein